MDKILAIAITCTYIAAHKFGYEAKDGPSTWPGVCQSGTHQSPVDIKAFAIEIAPLSPLLFMNYERNGEITLKNNGHTVTGGGFERWGDKRPYIHGGGLNGTYELLQFHFHWSQRNDSGSEHTLALLHYPAELHLVHTKKEVTANEVDKIAVVGVFLAIGNSKEALQNLMPYVANVKNSNTSETIRGFSVRSFLPSHLETFYRYKGSLTTPGCDESVVWTLMAEPIVVTVQQMQVFREVKFASGKIGENVRPVQSLNDRRILFRPSKFAYQLNSASAKSLKLTLLTMTAASIYNNIFMMG